MTSCWERVSLINSPSPPQETSHGSTRPFGLRISKIFEGSVRISLEEESSALEEESAMLDDESSALDEETTTLDDESSTLDEDRASLEEEISTLEELFTSLRLELSGVEDELEAINEELEDSGDGPERRDELLDRFSTGFEDNDTSTGSVEDDDAISVEDDEPSAH